MKYPITDDMNHCLICASDNIHIHHAIAGNANRAKSTKFNLVMPLCPKHHNMSNNSVHLNPDMGVMSKIIGQLAFEKRKCAEGMTEDEARQEFRNQFGKSYL